MSFCGCMPSGSSLSRFELTGCVTCTIFAKPSS